MCKKVCIVSDGYPYFDNPEFAFVQELCEALAKQEIKVTVIAPQSILGIILRGRKKAPYKSYVNSGKYGIWIIRPFSVSFGGRFMKFQYWFNSKVIENVLKKIKDNSDVYYGHFWHNAYSLYNSAKKRKKKLVVASGESSIFLAKDYTASQIEGFLNYLSSVICVSTKNKNESIALKFCEEDKCYVLPNGYDSLKFYPTSDKDNLREKLGIPKDYFIVSFLGAFIERKGANRISEAINLLNDPKIKAIYIGKPQDGNVGYEPDKATSIFTGSLKHDDVREMLSSADAFVLPTYKEGCCNAIIEAMACGLPIISSDRDFNYDILNESNSILIEPTDINEIASAILKLKNDKNLLSKLSKGALLKSKELTIENRAKRIINILFDN